MFPCVTVLYHANPSFKSKSCHLCTRYTTGSFNIYLVARLKECLLPEPVPTVVRLYANQFQGTPPQDISRTGSLSGQTWVKGPFVKANMTRNAPTEHIPIGPHPLRSCCTHPGDRIGNPTSYCTSILHFCYPSLFLHNCLPSFEKPIELLIGRLFVLAV